MSLTIEEQYAQYRETKMTPLSLEDWLKERLDEVQEEWTVLFDLAWEQHFAFLRQLIRIASENGVRADDFHQVMSDEDRKNNIDFMEGMHWISNPHLRE